MTDNLREALIEALMPFELEENFEKDIYRPCKVLLINLPRIIIFTISICDSFVYIYSFIRYAKPFSRLSLEKRKTFVNNSMIFTVPPFRQYLKVYRTYTLLTFFECKEIQNALNYKPNYVNS